MVFRRVFWPPRRREEIMFCRPWRVSVESGAGLSQMLTGEKISFRGQRGAKRAATSARRFNPFGMEKGLEGCVVRSANFLVPLEARISDATETYLFKSNVRHAGQDNP